MRRLNRVAFALLLAPAVAAGAAPHPGCEPVLRALALLDAHPQVRLRLDVLEGRHPDALRRFEIVRAAGREQRFIDGRPLGRPSPGFTPDPFMLAPESACEPAAAPPAEAAPREATPAAERALRYSAWAERGSSRVTMRIDPASGLPTRVEREGPELAWGRSLSRPTKPPQPELRPTGRRIVEVLVIEATGDRQQSAGR